MQRRKFITLLGGAAAASGMAWPLGARAQLGAPRPRIAFLASLGAEDIEGHARLTAFQEGLAELGWLVGRNLDMDYRSAGRDTERLHDHAHEMAASMPQVLVAGGAPALAALMQATRFLPIIFANATTDQGNTGYMARLARPARNAAGFMNAESRFGCAVQRGLPARTSSASASKQDTSRQKLSRFRVRLRNCSAASVAPARRTIKSKRRAHD